MILRTKGKPKNVSKKLCEKAARFYADRLLHSRTKATIDLQITFKKSKKILGDGWCDWEDKSHKPRVFLIALDRSLSQKKMLLALAHEMVHLKQFATGEMKDMAKGNTVKWRGEIMSRDGLYWDHPWEIEAYGKELGLYMMFMTEEN